MEASSDIKTNPETSGFEFTLRSNCGLSLIETELIDSVMEDGRQSGYFSVNVSTRHFGDETLFDLDSETVEFRLSGIVLDLDRIKEMKDALTQPAISEISEQFRLGVPPGPKFELAISKNPDAPANPEKARLSLLLEKAGNTRFETSFVIDPSCVSFRRR